MLWLKYVLFIAGLAMLASALVQLAQDLWRLYQASRKPRDPDAEPESSMASGMAPPIRWRRALNLAAFGLVPMLIASAIVVVPAGTAGVRTSQISGTKPGALYPGVHWVTPLIDGVTLYDTRDAVFTTAAVADAKRNVESLKVQSKEGLVAGMAVTVRYRIDPRRLDYVHVNLPGSIGEEIVAPAVASVFREVAPAYLMKELFSTRREEARDRAAGLITKKLAADGLLVKEVMIRDLVLPAEYSKGLEGILLKQQENERMAYEVEIKQKLVRTATLEAEAEKARQIKRAEADAQTTVLRAKAEADAMQHTLPLKEKQIQQTRLEAEARKESTVKNAEAMAEAKVIDSRAEFERGKLMADAEANRIRVTSAADSEKMRVEAAALRDSPLLIQKIIAERLSDRVQIMMVPFDGKFFFTNDVLKSAQLPTGTATAQP